MKWSSSIRKWSRLIHRDLSFFFAGMVLIYAISGIVMKVFLKGGSNLQVNVRTGEAVYESVTRRPLIGAMARLHYNPGQWWTYFADIFAVGLIIITLSGVIMLKGSKGIIGRGGIEMIVGIVIPILFLLFF